MVMGDVTWNTFVLQTHPSQHTSFSLRVEQCPWIPTVHGVTHATHNTPIVYRSPRSVTSSSESLWCVSTSYTNNKVIKGVLTCTHCSNDGMCTLCSLNTQLTHFYYWYTSSSTDSTHTAQVIGAVNMGHFEISWQIKSIFHCSISIPSLCQTYPLWCVH